MNENLTKKEVLLPQKFSSNGVRLDSLADHPVLLAIFLEAGLGGNNFVYATDVAKLKTCYDKDKDGEISLEEAKEMGLKGTDKEITEAVVLLNTILSTELVEQESYPLKITDSESVYYDNNGKILSRTVIDEGKGEFEETVYQDGNRDKIVKKYVKEFDGTLHFVEYNQFDFSKIQSEAIVSPSGMKTKRIFSYDQKNNLKSCYESGNNYRKVTMYDEQERVAFIREELGNIVRRITNLYDDVLNKMTRKIEGDPRLLTEGISLKQFVYRTKDGQIAGEPVSEVNILFDGKVVKVK
jgi:Ca2+-binding EF-hand superfamily protein